MRPGRFTCVGHRAGAVGQLRLRKTERIDLSGSKARAQWVRSSGGPAVASVLLVAAAACGNGGDAGGGSTAASTGGATASGVIGTVNVFAAASLTETFTKLGEQFTTENPGADVQFNFGPSSGLFQQIDSGAPADVFASADTNNMNKATEAGVVNEPVVFASNMLVIAVATDNPGDVNNLTDLADPGLKVALCEEQVPCGTTSKAVFEKAEINVTPVTREKDVKSVLTKVRLGEVDAGLVYATDALAAADEVRSIEIPSGVAEPNDYPIAVVKDAPNADGAQAFIDLVRSEDGKRVLDEAGFTTK